MSEGTAIRKRHFAAEFSIPQLKAALCGLPSATIAPTGQVLRNAAKGLIVLALLQPKAALLGSQTPRRQAAKSSRLSTKM